MKRILRCIKSIAKLFLGYFRNKHLQKRTIYAWYYKYGSIRKRTILYESFFGRHMLCNPAAIFYELLEQKDFKKFTHIWAISNDEQRKLLKKQYKKYRNVKFIKYGRMRYLNYLATAQYLVNNVTFPSYYTKKDGQVYLNTWHGIPFKTLGFDMPNGKTEATNAVRNFLSADYLLAANDFMLSMYEDSYKLKQIYDGKIIAEGYPRLDMLVRFSKEEIFKKLERYGVLPDPGKKIILYAPTWKGASYASPDVSVEQYFEFKRQLEACIDTTKYQVLIKVHQRVFELAGDLMKEPFFVPAWIDANEILAVTDILVSDFSSIFYDYLATERPVLFYIPDLETYETERGMYRGIDHLPGPVTESVEALAEQINKIEEVKQQWMEKYRECQSYANAGACGDISRKVIDIVFRGNEEGYRIHTVEKGKKKLYLSRGKMRTNGISSSVLNLLKLLDYDKYDVTLMCAKCPEDTETKLLDEIPPQVRVFYRNSTYNMTLFENLAFELGGKLRMINPYKKAYQREWRRCSADVKFDVLVDFEGYGYINLLAMIQNRDVPVYVWMHNDMMAERAVRFPWLTKIFKLYRHCTALVACGENIMKVNREKMMGKYGIGDNFRYASNTINAERIYNMAGQPAEIELVPEYAPAGERNYRFITIGRMSPEKNHENLLRAFHQFHEECSNSCLYMLGDGALRERTLELIEELKLGDCVIAPGNVQNPYAVLANADCFVLPSLHEGQPMVIHEARCLHKPMILSRFSSVEGCLIEDGQLLIGMEKEDIYAGMVAFVQGKVPKNYIFDPGEYNAKAVKEFYNAIGMGE